ncbi:DUF4386 family protein [Geodermatophilus sp. YIM 151500]|uniref:aldo/keto reductase n=1 Tax=Geodermatophilus sp. YIM 151500 TaxID=2984531 RepID=UPI0021E37404|nr:aldo/keto reductase [Geodermatophilus sp. YIM 151500]MCV2489308.1 DUF4386 family protein [Geodermatophilus sp. YIM 151500]
MAKRQDESLALGFVTSRVLEAAIILIGVLSLFAVVTLRQELAGAPGTDDASLVPVGAVLVAVRDWTFLLGPGVMPAVNALLLGTLVYRSGLVPRVLPLMGLVGAPLLLAAQVVTVFGVIDDTSPWSTLAVAPIFSGSCRSASGWSPRASGPRPSPPAARPRPDGTPHRPAREGCPRGPGAVHMRLPNRRSAGSTSRTGMMWPFLLVEERGERSVESSPTRTLGSSGIRVGAVGLGCWAIGGPAYRDGRPIGWGKVDDRESIAAIHAAVDAGVTLFDTASIYGAGHSERILGHALRGVPDTVVVATKFGHLFDEETRTATGRDASPASVREQCEASLRRLGREVIDVYQLHLGDYDPDGAEHVVAVLEELVAEGKVRSYGWSTDDPARAAVFARGGHCSAIQFAFNVLHGDSPVLDVCETRRVAGLARSPLAMGALSGKFSRESTFGGDDVRSTRFDFTGADAEIISAVDRVRDVLCSGGRTMAQGALCWLLARSDVLVPIPGFRTIAQARENAGALAHGPLDDDELQQIDAALERAR